jgi:hypothetical protein
MSKKLILEKSEAEHIYRALVEANALSCPMFAMAVRRHENEVVGHLDSVLAFEWHDYTGTDKARVAEVVIREMPVLQFSINGLSGISYAIEVHDTQDAFRLAYNLD